jgi:hypothetical protein
MITGLVLVDDAIDELAATLGSLVPAVVEGLMGDAVVIARRPHASVANIAEVAGARLVALSGDEDPWLAGAAHARRDWLLCLEAGDVPGEGWMRAVDRFLMAGGRDARPLGRFRYRAGGAASFRGPIERWTGTKQARAGDLVDRNWLATTSRTRVRPARIGAVIHRDAMTG